MVDREEVIAGIDICLHRFRCGEDCPYYPYDTERTRGCMEQLREDAITLLKEQEDQIEQLEHDLAVTQNNLNYYVNGND